MEGGGGGWYFCKSLKRVICLWKVSKGVKVDFVNVFSFKKGKQTFIYFEAYQKIEMNI